MLLQFCLILTVALLLNYLFSRISIPGILGMIATGIILGPAFLDLLGTDVREILQEFKTAALIVILIRAGLGINKKTLQKVGKPAIRMSFIPGVLEGTIVLLAAHFILGMSFVASGMLGFIIAAVSPAVVVPQMLELKEGGFGKKKEVPTLVLAGASVDDVFAITIFSVFVGLASGGEVNVSRLLFTVPMGIILGALIGLLLGLALVWFFKRYHIRDTKKVIIFMIIAVAFYELTELPEVKSIIPLAGLLGIMAIGYMLFEKYDLLANRLSAKFNKIWVLAEILLFVYIGTEVRIQELSSELIGTGLIVLLLGLIARSGGVWLSLLNSTLNTKERLFCVIAYLPKATVQAAIGAVPITMIKAGSITGISLETGQIILSIAVLSIVVTAPLGAIGIKLAGPKLLVRDN